MKMKTKLMNDIFADATDEKVGQRMRVVVEAIVFTATYAYVLGEMTHKVYENFIRLYDTHWVGMTPYRSTQQPLALQPALASVVEIKPHTQPVEMNHTIKPFKRSQAKGFGN